MQQLSGQLAAETTPGFPKTLRRRYSTVLPKNSSAAMSWLATGMAFEH